MSAIRALNLALLLTLPVSGRADDVILAESLESCDRQGKNLCFTGVVPDRYLINQAISDDDRLLTIYKQLRPEKDDDDLNSDGVYDPVLSYRRRRQALLSSKTGSATSITDCGAVCCFTSDTTPPFSYFKDNDGWHQVASTPEYPLRVSFFTETCTNERSACRGVKAIDQDYQAQCEQMQHRHSILIYNQTLGGVQTRYITLPSGCKCKITPINPFKLLQGQPKLISSSG